MTYNNDIKKFMNGEADNVVTPYDAMLSPNDFFIKDPDTITTTPTGMNQSRSEYMFDLVPPVALLSIARVFAEGYEKYDKATMESASLKGVDPERLAPNWMGGTTKQHIGRVMAHLTLWASGDRTEDHLAHAMVRCIMAYTVSQTR
jgi:hypothetical protein